ncbi:MAG: hypothetical protein ACO29N_02140 [Candidatus Nanopelagicaceae bacterium]|nr:hypothetical protein [Actinomycetota bacterium]
MRAWPTLDLPTLTDVFPDLELQSSYSNKTITLSQSKCSMYVCGITPYDATHLGHAATYLTFDLIHRYLLASGKKVHFVENITDIDDPLLERAERDHLDWVELAEKEIELFRSDMTALRVLPPQFYIGAVESIPDVISAIEIYQSRNLTYVLDGDVYLSLKRIPGALENLPVSYSEAIEIFRQRGGDPDRPGKEDPLDTVLWLSKKPGEPFWSSPYGDGRPGWHIECTAISLKYLAPMKGDEDSQLRSIPLITLQGGGSDLLFPHHYMSSVQARALRGREFSTLYVHAGMIGLDGEKMSKSKGNLVFVSKLLSDGVDPMTIRIALLRDKYSHDRMWSNDLLLSAESLRARMIEALAQTHVVSTDTLRKEIISALSQGLNTEKVFHALEDWLQHNIQAKADERVESSGVIARFLDGLLGLTF